MLPANWKISLPSRKKGRFSGVVEGVAEVDVDLAGVDFDLAEVGIDRRRPGSGRCVKPTLPVRPKSVSRSSRLQAALIGGLPVAVGHGGQELDDALEARGP